MEVTMGKRNKVTTRDIAEYAGVSQSTVSMILSEKKNVFSSLSCLYTGR